MNILVYDVAAENGGALSVLEQFYRRHRCDLENHYYYLLSVAHLENTENITVINRPEVKKSWLHRMWFDWLKAPGIIRANHIDEVLSLQNTVVPRFKGRQTVCMHNILPFSDYRFSFVEDRKLWVYQNLIGWVITRSLKRADHVIVQADWIRDEIEKRVPECFGKVEVRFPEVDIPAGYRFQMKNCRRFFYPASGERFKNHRLVIDALRLLKEQTVDVKVVFTLCGDESDEIVHLKACCDREALPVVWQGYLDRNSLFEEYTRSILIYPSYIETIGLPLYEAAQVGAPILAADCVYARSVLRDDPSAVFFDPRSADSLAETMKNTLETLA